jgi:hypothetical protein
MKHIKESIIVFFIFAASLWIGLSHFREKKKMKDIQISSSILAECLNWERKVESMGIDPSGAIARISSIQVINTEEYAGVYDRSSSRIEISSRVFDKGEYSVRSTIYHELGHAVFKLEHGDCGIMNDRILSEEYLRNNWDDLLTEYLKKCYEKRLESI